MFNRPIGIFDSGIGGLSIWRSIVALLPYESTIFVGDHKHLPYGTKTKAYIRKRAVSIIRYLSGRGAKVIVVGCNTATVAGIEYYRTVFPDTPIIGVVPVVKTAAEQSKTKKIAVLSTQYTANSLYQKYLIDTFAGSCKVYNIGCKNIVDLVELGTLNAVEIELELKALLGPALKDEVDVIALGCTHYAFLKDTIGSIAGIHAAILDSGPAVARHVQRILKHNQMLVSTQKPTYSFYTTGVADNTSRVATGLMGRPIYVIHKEI